MFKGCLPGGKDYSPAAFVARRNRAAAEYVLSGLIAATEQAVRGIYIA